MGLCVVGFDVVGLKEGFDEVGFAVGLEFGVIVGCEVGFLVGL